MPTDTRENNRVFFKKKLIEKKTMLVWQKKKAFMLNMERLGSILALPNEIDKGFHLDLSYITEDPKSGNKESKEMVIKKAKGNQNTTIGLQTETQTESNQFELEISYGEMLIFQRLLDVNFTWFNSFEVLFALYYRVACS